MDQNAECTVVQDVVLLLVAKMVEMTHQISELQLQ